MTRAVTRLDAHEHEQKLSLDQELKLKEWILVQDSLAPPTHSRATEFAHRIAKKNGYSEPMGRHWMGGFLGWHLEVKTLRSQRLDIARLNGATTKRIKDFFVILEIPEIKAIKRENQYNMDKCDIMEGQGHNGLVLCRADAGRRLITVTNLGSRTWTTIVKCISADGRFFTPLVIFKGRSVQQQWFPEVIDLLKERDFTATNKGWLRNQVALI